MCSCHLGDLCVAVTCCCKRMNKDAFEGVGISLDHSYLDTLLLN